MLLMDFPKKSLDFYEVFLYSDFQKPWKRISILKIEEIQNICGRHFGLMLNPVMVFMVSISPKWPLFQVKY